VHTAGRVLVAVLLVAVVAGAGVHYDIAEPTQWPYPTGNELADTYEPAVDEQTLLLGEVQSIDNDDNTAIVTVEHDTGTFDMRVTNFDVTVTPGATIQVYGTLQPDYTIGAQSVVIVNPAGSSTTYKYAVSVVGALLVLAVFFRRWRFDTETRGFVPRGE
jgi:hypothetical protein